MCVRCMSAAACLLSARLLLARVPPWLLSKFTGQRALLCCTSPYGVYTAHVVLACCPPYHTADGLQREKARGAGLHCERRASSTSTSVHVLSSAAGCILSRATVALALRCPGASGASHRRLAPRAPHASFSSSLLPLPRSCGTWPCKFGSSPDPRQAFCALRCGRRNADAAIVTSSWKI